MTPTRAREWVLIATRDILPPAIGAYLCIVRGWPSEAWQLPGLAGLFGFPLVAPRSAKDGAEPDDS